MRIWSVESLWRKEKKKLTVNLDGKQRCREKFFLLSPNILNQHIFNADVGVMFLSSNSQVSENARWSFG